MTEPPPPEPLPRCVDVVVALGDEQILGAMGLLMDAVRVRAEPSGAAGLAAILRDQRFAGWVAAVVTGRDIDLAL